MATAMDGGYNAGPPQVSFDWISRAWDLFKRWPGTWMFGSLLFIGIPAVLFLAVLIPTGLLAYFVAASHSGGIVHSAPTSQQPSSFISDVASYAVQVAISVIASGGLFRMALRQLRTGEVRIGDFIFLDGLLPLIGVGIVTGILSGLTLPFCCFPSFIVQGLLMFAPIFVVDRKAGVLEAISASFSELKNQWMMAAVYYLVCSLLASLGAIACCVGIFVTNSVFYISIAIGYVAFSDTNRQMPGYGPAMQGVWPPPPSSNPQQPYYTQAPPQTPQFGQSPSSGQPELSDDKLDMSPDESEGSPQ